MNMYLKAIIIGLISFVLVGLMIFSFSLVELFFTGKIISYHFLIFYSMKGGLVAGFLSALVIVLFRGPREIGRR